MSSGLGETSTTARVHPSAGEESVPRRVLLVDDDPEMLRAYSRLMKSSGHDVVEANCGVETLARARECRPDLILLDMVLPDLDGITVCQHLTAAPLRQDAHIISSALSLLKVRQTKAHALTHDSLQLGAPGCKGP
jgi:CheY-like chemotaxis protein